ncbi:MAG: hypothetical protein HFE97_06905 [Oscillospiraceae bacterium]|nr:hypothetical protein [Oscillospiraceae bacterium]
MKFHCRGPLEDPQNDPPVNRCDRCKGELYQGELLYHWEEQAVCLECFQAGVGRLLKNDPRLLAQELGVETQLCTSSVWEEGSR